MLVFEGFLVVNFLCVLSNGERNGFLRLGSLVEISKNV